jgi:anti-sigma regulatory factor (Ser/Thr protein kinase)
MNGASSRPPSIHIGMKLPNLMFLTRPCREFVSLTLRSQGFGDEEIEDIAIVCTEAVNNSFEHASEREWHEVEIEMEIDPRRWIFRIRDEGEGRLRQEDFDFSGPPEHYGDRGRGLFLIARLSDQVHVRRIAAGGTELEIVKFRKGQA